MKKKLLHAEIFLVITLAGTLRYVIQGYWERFGWVLPLKINLGRGVLRAKTIKKIQKILKIKKMTK